MSESTPPESLSLQELDHIRELLRIVSDNSLLELSLGQPSGFTVTARTVSDAPSAPQVVTVPAAEPAPQQVAVAPHSGRNPLAEAIESPMVGTYYRAQTPADPPFVKEGDVISVGQTIGLIEAMKVYSEIPAERTGRIIEIVVGNGQLVQLGQPLMYIEPV